MTVIAYKIGGISTDDYSLVKQLLLPSDAADDNPVTFHDPDGNDYQVPASHIYVASKVAYLVESTGYIGRIGESDSADSAISKEVIILPGYDKQAIEDVFGVFAASKYVTGETTNTNNDLMKDAMVYGVEIDIS